MTKFATPFKAIVMLTERWVFIGTYNPATKTTPAHLTDASCVRVWGTTAGLGELALRGPTPNTKLDPCGTLVLQNPASVIAVIPCNV